MYDEIAIIGNLGQDPEMRYTPAGTPVTNFSVAVNRKWTSKDGEPGEQTVWYRITAWGRLAEVCNEYLSKGRQVFLKGQLTPDGNGGPRIWHTSEGEPRASFEVNAQLVKFLGGKEESRSPVVQEEPGEFDPEELPF